MDTEKKLTCEDCVHLGENHAGGNGEYFCAHPDIDWGVPVEDEKGNVIDWIAYDPNWSTNQANGCEQYSTNIKDKLL
jgi:hypothetical protein